MIPTSADVVEVISNVKSENSGQFTVDENSLGKIMGVLTNLYSDPELAVVREYLTNALDSQIEAQEKVKGYKWRPIEVTLPSRFSKEYSVRDFGIGMSADDLRDIYSKYGKSTKESSNSVTGMLGLGSKCALTYTNQFTITGIKDGMKTLAIVTKDENDIPTFMIMDTSATKEPNGVQISIPVRDVNSFAEKTANFLKFWKDGQVLVNGSEPVKHNYKHVQTSPVTYKVQNQPVLGSAEVHIIERDPNRYYSESPQSVVVMGNVPYLVDQEYVAAALRNAGLGFVAFVPMGSVTFPPNREVLTYNTMTKDVIKQISEGLFESILKVKLDEIQAAPDKRTAHRLHSALPSHFANHQNAKDLKYKGLSFTEKFQHNVKELSWDWQDHGQISERSWVYIGNALRDTAVIVTGVPDDSKPTSYFKKKVRYYIQEQNYPEVEAILVENDITEAWLADVPRVDAQTIKDIKLPKTGANAGPRAEAPLDYYMCVAGNVTSASAVDIPVPAGKTIAYISPQDIKETYRKPGTTPATLAKHLGEDIILVVLGKNRFEKFARNYPTAKTVKVAMQEKVNSLVASATSAEYVVSQLGYGEKEFLSKVDVNRLDDPELVTLANTVQSKGQTKNYQSAEELVNFGRRADLNLSIPEKPVVANTIRNTYPLIDNVGSRKMDHLIIYVNAVFAHNKAKP